MSDASSSNRSPFAAISRRAHWAGTILMAIAVLFLTFDAVIKVVELPIAVEGTMQLGYPAGVIRPIGLIEVACLALYLWPRTALLGAVLWVGYLGGAIATHVRVGNPLFTHTLFPIYIAALLWGGLWLRSARTRQVVRDAFGLG